MEEVALADEARECDEAYHGVRRIDFPKGCQGPLGGGGNRSAFTPRAFARPARGWAGCATIIQPSLNPMV